MAKPRFRRRPIVKRFTRKRIGKGRTIRRAVLERRERKRPERKGRPERKMRPIIR